MSLKTHLAYPKFARPPYRLLLIDADLYPQPEMAAALRHLGHTVQIVRLPQGDPGEMLTTLLHAAVAMRPDAILTENHAGFDEGGEIAAILHDLGLPVIVWYLDDFRLLIGEGRRLIQPNTLVFTVERSHVPLLQAIGFPHVHYLPSASGLDPTASYPPLSSLDLSRATSLVGHTFEYAKQKHAHPLFPDLLADLIRTGLTIAPGQDLVRTILERQGHHFNQRDEAYRYAAFVTADATQRYRTAVLRQLRAEALHIFGDAHWKALGIPATLHERIDSQREAPAIYRHSLINLNLSSPQLISAVNLRVYDVPAAAGFLLTDWRDDLPLLFDIRREVVTFRSVEEANDRIAYYERRPSARELIVAAAHARVRREHLLTHRMDRLLTIARETFGIRRAKSLSRATDSLHNQCLTAPAGRPVQPVECSDQDLRRTPSVSTGDDQGG